MQIFLCLSLNCCISWKFYKNFLCNHMQDFIISSSWKIAKWMIKWIFRQKNLEIESKTPYICTKFRKKNMNITKSLKKIWKKGCFGYIFVVDFEIFGWRKSQKSHESHAKNEWEGSGTEASGSKSHAEGNSTHATGMNAHTEGSLTYATNSNSHAEGTATWSGDQLQDRTRLALRSSACWIDQQGCAEGCETS